jgi:hypothetical protein
MLQILDVLMCREGGMRLSARPRDRAAAVGAVTPIRSEFEVDVREVGGPGRPARIHFADWQHYRKRMETD